MRRALFSTGFVFALAASLAADSNLHISDVGLHGYAADPTAVRLVLRNPSSRPQVVHLRVSAGNRWGGSNGVTSEVSLQGNEQLELELPLQAESAQVMITADATASGAFFGHDTYSGPRGTTGNLIVLMCASESVCRTAQGQIQMSGSIENRADKNRETKIVTMADSREHWWAYSASNTVVLAMPTADLTPTQRDAFEGFLRSGGRLVLLEAEIADPTFLSTYRQTPPPAYGTRVGIGTLFRVAGLSADTLGDVFAGHNLDGVIHPRYESRTDWLLGRFGATFDFPRLRWVLLSMAAYILLIGILNFALLRRLHRLEFGWITVCALAFLVAAGIYFFSASRRPQGFSLDSLATYYLDGQSPLAVVDYTLRVSAPERRDVLLSVSDPAVFSGAGSTVGQPNSQIWAEISQRTPPVPYEDDLHLGPPTQVELSMLKWSSRDLSLRGIRKLAGTVHFVAPDRLRNDTGQHFSASVYFDSSANALYSLPPLAPGQEIQLEASTRTPIGSYDTQGRWNHTGSRDRTDTLRDLALRYAAPFSAGGKVFAGLSDGPALPVELDVPCQRNIHSLIVVNLERP